MFTFSLRRIRQRALALSTAITVAIAGGTYAQQTSEPTQEELLWAYIQLVGNADAYAAYLIDNPTGQFADTARASLRSFAQNGVFPSEDVAGIEIVVPQGVSLSDLVSGQDVAGLDLGQFVTIEYAA